MKHIWVSSDANIASIKLNITVPGSSLYHRTLGTRFVDDVALTGGPGAPGCKNYQSALL